MNKQYYKNAWQMTKFTFKHDKVRILIWLAVLILFDMYCLPYLDTMYPTVEARETFKEMLENPAMIAMFGRGYGLDNYTYATFYAHVMYVWLGIFNVVMAILITSKHLRAEEEDGRYELVRSLPVGRNSNLLASIIIMTLTFTGFIVLKIISYMIVGIHDIDLIGTINFALGLGLIGLLFSMITAFVAQLFRTNRSVLGISFGVFGISYLLFMIGSVSSDILLWMSPFQWMVHSQSFVNDLFWPLALLLITSIIFGVLALKLSSIRDIDSGIFKEKSKPHKEKNYINGIFSFTLYLNKKLIAVWFGIMLVLALVYGSIFGDIEGFVGGNELFENIIPSDSNEPLSILFMGFIMTIMGIAAVIPSLLILNKISGEERKDRMDILYSHSVSRNQVVISHFIVAAVVGIISLLAVAFGLYISTSAVMDDPISLGIIIKSALVYYPCIILFMGLSVLVSGIAPRKSWILWIILALGFILSYLGPVLGLSSTITNISPFSNVPNVGIEDINWITQLIILSSGLVIGFIGNTLYNKRDLI